MTSRDIRQNRDNIGPETGSECVKSLDSGQSVEVIPDWVVRLSDELTVSMCKDEFRRPIEGTFGEALRQMEENRKIVHQLIRGGSGEKYGA